MEKGCILPESKIKELELNSLVLKSLAQFCNTTSEDLLNVLSMRNQIKEDKYLGFDLVYGYRSYIQKKGKKQRKIDVPDHSLKSIQKALKDRLQYIPISLSATAGKIGDNIKQNVIPHVEHPYLLTMDIKDAYPSISTNRIFKSFKGSFNKPINIRFPYLKSNENKDLFTRAITHLCVYNNSLPQGAPTSTVIQNIVMKELDSKMILKLPELLGEEFAYTRYADDIAISFANYITKNILTEKLDELKIYLDSIDHNTSTNNIRNKLEKFNFVITDSSEKKYIINGLNNIKNDVKNSNILSSDQIYTIIGLLNSFNSKFKVSNYNVFYFKHQIYKILSQEGWKANDRKTKVWTPQSNSDREITGLSIDNDNQIGISKKKKSTYIRLFEDLKNMSLEELYLNDYYKKMFFNDNELIKQKIFSKIDGIFKGYIHKIYGDQENIPKYISNLYSEVKDKYGSLREENIINLDILEELKKQKFSKNNVEGVEFENSGGCDLEKDGKGDGESDLSDDGNDDGNDDYPF